MDDDLHGALDGIARLPRLLVACDYDGTLSPIVEDPARAVPLPGAVAVVRSLAALADTEVAVVSGRALWDLSAVSGMPPEVHLVGSHGAEFAFAGPAGLAGPPGLADLAGRLPPELAELRSRLSRELTRLAAGRDGVRLEEKPASITVHTRTAPRDIATEVVAAVRSGPATWPGVHAMDGKEVIELAVLPANKGAAVHALRIRFGSDAVIFLGDDVTDETVFASLRDGDVAIKVGEGTTRAGYRVPDPSAAVRALALLAGTRSSPR